jgi:predicted GNAT family acetyltransferase
MELRVADNPNKARYEITVLSDNGEGEIAGFVTYHLAEHTISFVHAETDPRFRGDGIGGQLVSAALDSARKRGLEVLPFCPFVRSWMGEHPEYTDLVPAARRAEFGL